MIVSLHRRPRSRAMTPHLHLPSQALFSKVGCEIKRREWAERAATAVAAAAAPAAAANALTVAEEANAEAAKAAERFKTVVGDNFKFTMLTDAPEIAEHFKVKRPKIAPAPDLTMTAPLGDQAGTAGGRLFFVAHADDGGGTDGAPAQPEALFEVAGHGAGGAGEGDDDRTPD